MNTARKLPRRLGLASAITLALCAGCAATDRSEPPSGPISEMRLLGSDHLRHTATVVSLALSGDGKTLAAGDCAGVIKLYAARTGGLRHTLRGHRNTVIALALNADGTRLLSGGEDGTIRLWDAVEGRALSAATDPAGAVWSVAFTGRGVTGSAGNEAGDLRMVDLERGRIISTFKAHADRISSVRILSHLCFLTASFDGTVRLWAARAREAEVLLGRHDGAATCLALSPSGDAAVSCGFDGRLRLWDVAREKAGPVFGETKGNYFSVVYVDPKQVLSVKDDGAVELWRVPEGTLARRLSGHHDAAWCAVADGDGRAWTGGADNAVRCWDTEDGRELLVRPGHQHEVRAVAFTAEGAQLHSEGRDGKRLAWDLGRGRLIGDAPPAEPRAAVRFQPICDSNSIALWDDEKRAMLWQVSVALPPVAAAVRGDGSFCVVITESGIALLSGATGATLAALADPHAPSCLALSPDGATLAVGHRDTTISLYRLNPPPPAPVQPVSP
jgi:WD40 repeat protein